jgi:hypothetical protein
LKLVSDNESMADPEEDEWEYEYDEDETEDFYITLDLSSLPTTGNALAPTGSIRPSLSGNPILLQSRLRALNAARRTEDTTMSSANTAESAPVGEIQIVDLHTSNPLIMYNGQLLSCKWVSTIGTDMFFVKPNGGAESEASPLRSLPSVDLLAMSSTKLMATPARLRPRDEVIENMIIPREQAVPSVEPSGDLRQGVEDLQTRSPQTVPISAEEPLTAPKSFLARLNEAKAKRGDKTFLKTSTTPNGRRLIATPAREQAVPASSTSTKAVEESAMGGMDEQTSASSPAQTSD